MAEVGERYSVHLVELQETSRGGGAIVVLRLRFPRRREGR